MNRTKNRTAQIKPSLEEIFFFCKTKFHKFIRCLKLFSFIETRSLYFMFKTFLIIQCTDQLKYSISFKICMSIYNRSVCLILFYLA